MAIKITGTNTAAAPGVTGDDTDTGLFYGTNEIGFSTGGTSRATVDSSGDLNILTGHLTLPDSKHIKLGNSSDFEIHHNTAQNWIENNGTFALGISVNNKAEYAAEFKANSGVDLYYDNSKKFETSSTGVSVTGQVVATTNFKGADSVDLVLGTGSDFRILHDGTDNVLTSDGGQSIRLVNHLTGGNETMGKFIPNGGVELYHNNVRKLNTEVAGIRVDGASGGDGILSLYSNAGNSNSNLWRIESAASGSNFYIKNGASGSWETNIRCVGNDQVQLYYDNSLKFETSSTGAKVSGRLDVDGNLISYSANNNSLGLTGHRWNDLFIANDIDILDNSVILIGTGNDLNIWHDGSNSNIENQTGQLRVRGSYIFLRSQDAQETHAQFTVNGASELFYDNSKKLETTSTGALATGKFCIGAADRNIDWHHPLQVEGISAETSSISICRNSNDVNPPYLTFCKTRGTAVGGTTVVNDNDLIANIQFKAADGDAGESTAAQITAEIDGTPGSSDTPGRIVFKTSSDGSGSPTTRMTIDSSGNINMPSDSKYFRIGADNDIQLYHISGVNYWKNQGSTVFKMVDTGGDTQIECNNNDATKLFYNGSEKFYTTSGGTCTLGNMYAEAGGICQTLVHTGTGEIARFRANTSSTVGNITVSASSTTYNTSSDYRLKENTVPLSDGITRLKTLKPYRFNFKVEPSKTVDGFFAHEVTPAVPEAITGEKDASEMQQIDQSKLVPLLTAALQEAIGKIEVLETKVAALEAS